MHQNVRGKEGLQTQQPAVARMMYIHHHLLRRPLEKKGFS